jgi:hypothetical protein
VITWDKPMATDPEGDAVTWVNQSSWLSVCLWHLCLLPIRRNNLWWLHTILFWPDLVKTLFTRLRLKRS